MACRDLRIALLAPVLVFASACARTTVPEDAGIAWPAVQALVLPDAPGDDFGPDTWRESAESRYLGALWLETTGRHEQAIDLLLDGEQAWPAALERARALRVLALEQSVDLGEAHRALAAARANDPTIDTESRLLWALAAAADDAPGSLEVLTPASWTVAGPFSSLGTLDLNKPTPVESLPAIPQRADFGAGTVVAARVPSEAAGARVRRGKYGVYVAETFFSVDAPSDVELLVSAPFPYVVLVDGEVVASREPVTRFEADTTTVGLRLAAGTHRLVVRGSPGDEDRLRAALVPLDPGSRLVRFDAEPGDDSAQPAGVAVTRPPVALGADAFLNSGADHLDWFVAVDAAVVLGDGVGAERLLDHAGSTDTMHPVVAMRVAHLGRAATSLAPSVRDEIEYSALSQATAAWEDAVGAATMLAELLLARERVHAAWEVIDAASVRAPTVAAVQRVRAEVADARGWDVARRNALEAVLLEDPADCDAALALARIRLDAGEPVGPELWSDEAMLCPDLGMLVVEDALLAVGEVEAALSLATRLLGRHPENPRIAALAANIAASIGGTDAGERVISTDEPFRADTGSVQAWRADAALASGDASLAQQHLEFLSDAWPAYIPDVVARAFVTREPVASSLVPGSMEAVREYIDANPGYDAPVVYVRDYAGIRFFEDGSSLEHVHQIVQVRTRDALGDYGEQGVPGDALLLSARTIKPDGRTFVPVEIEGKSSISMPNLELGDFIELEWLRPRSEAMVGRNVARTERFYFRGFDGPFFRSVAEYTVPAGWPEPMIDLRGDGLTVEHTERHGLRTVRVSIAESPAAVFDPRSVSVDELLPSVRLAWGLDWELTRAVYVDAIAPLVIETPEIERRAREVVAGARSQREAVHRLFRLVSDEIVDRGGFLSTPAAWTLSAGEGERTPLLLALLSAAGFDPELVFVRPWDQDHSESPIPDSTVYDLTAVRVRLPNEEIWLEPDPERYPFDYLRPDAQRADAIVITGPRAGERLVTPAWPDHVEFTEIELDIAFDSTGDARVDVREHLPLRSSHGIRLYVQSAEDLGQVERQLESALAQSFPSVSSVRIAIHGLDDPDSRVRVDYHFDAPSLADPSGSGLVFDGEIFTRPLNRWYGERESRQDPLLVAFPTRERVVVRFTPPDGWRVPDLPRSAERSIDSAEWSRTWTRDGGAVSMTRAIDIGIQRIEPDAYRAFSAALSALAEGDRLRIVMEPRR